MWFLYSNRSRSIWGTGEYNNDYFQFCHNLSKKFTQNNFFTVVLAKIIYCELWKPRSRLSKLTDGFNVWIRLYVFSVCKFAWNERAFYEISLWLFRANKIYKIQSKVFGNENPIQVIQLLIFDSHHMIFYSYFEIAYKFYD